VPGFPGAKAHSNLGTVLTAQGKLNEAITAYREAINVQPDLTLPYLGLGNALTRQKKLGEAAAVLKKALDLDPHFAAAWTTLGLVLKEQGKPDEALAATNRSLAIDPKDAAPWSNLGHLRKGKQDLAGAIEAYKKALEIDAQLPEAWDGLGTALLFQKDYAGAVAAHQKAVQIDATKAVFHLNLGTALSASKDDEGAMRAYRNAIDSDPNDPKPHLFLGGILQRQGRFGEARESYRNSSTLASPNDMFHRMSSARMQVCERLQVLDEKLPGILKGDTQPASAGERLELAQLCVRYKKRYRVAAGLYAGAFAAEAKLAGDLNAHHRYDAACCAALAAAGKGADADADQLDDKDRARLRQQTRDWLAADLALWAKHADHKDARVREVVRKRLRQWQTDVDLAGLREPEALTKLPEAERAGWRKLWEEVEAVEKKAAEQP